MRKPLYSVLLAGAILLTGCPQDPHNFKITAENVDTFLAKDLKDAKGLTAGEIGLLVSYRMRSSFDRNDNEPDRMIGKTVGEVIKEQEAWLAQEEVRKKEEEVREAARKQEEQRLAEEAQARAAALTQQLREAVMVAVTKKTYIPSNWRARQYDDLLAFSFVAQNRSKKQVRAFEGHLRFKDLFGNEIYSTNLQQTNGIKAGYQIEWQGSIDYNQFVSEHKKMKNESLKNMQVEWEPTGIIFADGTTLRSDQ